MFKNGRISVADEERSGRPVTTATSDIVPHVNRVIQEDGRVKIKDVDDRVNVSVGINKL